VPYRTHRPIAAETARAKACITLRTAKPIG